MNNINIEHLSKTALESLSLSDEERINKIKQDKWIGYSQARLVLDKLEDLLYYPPRHRMPCLLIVGDTNNGKTMIVRRFLHLHPPNPNVEGDASIAPIMIVQAPPVPDESRFYNNILNELFAEYRENDRSARKYSQVIRLLKAIKLRMLVIDEIHDILAGSTKKQHEFLNVIKNLSNELMIPIVGVGTRDALRALQTDPQLSNRFEPISIPKWTMDQDYLRLLASFEKVLPLKKPSHLTQNNIAQKLLTMSEGFIGELSRILTKAAIKAIESNTEQINIKILDILDWVKPSERRKAAEKDF